jgi:hypothetical protein
MFDIELIAIAYYTIMAIFSYVNNKMRRKITKEVSITLDEYINLEKKVTQLCDMCKWKDQQIDMLMKQLSKERSNSSDKSNVS